MVCVLTRKALPITESICLYSHNNYALQFYVSHFFYYDFELTAETNVHS